MVLSKHQMDTKDVYSDDSIYIKYKYRWNKTVLRGGLPSGEQSDEEGAQEEFWG
jgi:hypothetical protein